MSSSLVDKSATCLYCSGTLISPWKWLPGVYCINLKDRTDRRHVAEQELHRTGLCTQTTFFIADRSPDKRKGFGCYESHKSVCQTAYQLNQFPILVLEDDFVFENKTADELSTDVRTGLESLPENWTRLQLGEFPLLTTGYNKYVNRSASTLTHAQILSKRGCIIMKDLPFYTGVCHDLLLAVSLPRSYSLKPMICYQRPLGTDNTSSTAERMFLNPVQMKRAHIVSPLLLATVSLLCSFVWFAILSILHLPKRIWLRALVSVLLVGVPLLIFVGLLAVT